MDGLQLAGLAQGYTWLLVKVLRVVRRHVAKIDKFKMRSRKLCL